MKCPAKTGESVIMGVGRLSRKFGPEEAEFALLISDQYQRHGLGAELLGRLVEIGRQEGVKTIFAHILPENTGMQAVCKKLRFQLQRVPDENVIHAEIKL